SPSCSRSSRSSGSSCRPTPPRASPPEPGSPMSAIFAVVGGEPMSAADLQRAVIEMATRGAERMDCRAGDVGGVAAGRFEWEMEVTSSGPLVVDDGSRVVVLDGTLYYRDALRRAIAGRSIDLAGDSAGHLLLGAYRAW